MTTDKIKELLEAYYMGESTETEETELELYFRNKEVPAELEEEKKLFLAIHNSYEESLPENLESRLSFLITDQEENEYKMSRRKWLRIAGIAATIVLIFATAFFLEHNHQLLFGEKTDVHFSMQEQQKIYEETKQILSYISEELNNGLMEIEQSREDMKNTTNEIKRELNP